MLVQRVLPPASSLESWTVLGDDDLPVAPVERYLAYLTDIERSPNTVKAYAHDLKDWFSFLDVRGLDWREVRLEDLGEFVAWLRQILGARLSNLVKQSFPVGTLDITLYRDDLSTVAPQPLLKKTEIDFDLNGRTVLLCDDVLYTGRTIRAALDGVIDLGRPRAIRLAVLIDRGHREFPIEANYVGKSVPTANREVIQVMFQETDGADEVWILERPA